MVGGRVGAGVTGTQHRGQLLARLVAEAMQWVKAEAALAVRARAFLLAVALDKLRVEIQGDRRRPRTQRPCPLAHPPARLTDRRQLPLAEPMQQTRRRRRRSDQPEQIRLLRQRTEVGDTIAAVDQRRREINQQPSRIMLRPPPKQMRERARQLTLQAEP